MVKTIKFILITALVIIIQSLYFEYVFSREVNDFLGIACAIGSTCIFLGYAYYIYNLLTDVLKINSKN